MYFKKLVKEVLTLLLRDICLYPNNQTSLVIIIGGKPNGSFYQRPKCISMEAPIGMISSGVYQSNYLFYANRA